MTTTAPDTTPSAAGSVAALDQRQAQRKARFERARIALRGGAVDCMIENLSSGGARVRFSNPVVLPKLFALEFQDGRSRPVERRWAYGRVVGISFSDVDPVAAERQHLVQAARKAVTAGDRAGALRLVRQLLAL